MHVSVLYAFDGSFVCTVILTGKLSSEYWAPVCSQLSATTVANILFYRTIRAIAVSVLSLILGSTKPNIKCSICRKLATPLKIIHYA